MSKIIISLATEEDVPHLASIQRQGCRDNHWDQLTYAKVKEEYLEQFFAANIKNYIQPNNGTKIALKATRDGEIAGFALWDDNSSEDLGDSKGSTEGQEKKPQWPEGTNLKYAEEEVPGSDLGIKTKAHFCELYCWVG